MAIDVTTLALANAYAKQLMADSNSNSSQNLPAVTNDDDGKFLRVFGGVWVAESLDDVSEVEA